VTFNNLQDRSMMRGIEVAGLKMRCKVKPVNLFIPPFRRLRLGQNMHAAKNAGALSILGEPLTPFLHPASRDQRERVVL
jgi:hypothetical protein